MTEAIQNLDASVFLFFNSFHNDFFDNFMSLYSGRFIWIPTYAALLIVMLRRYSWPKVLCLLVGIALSITLADQICASLIRPVFERLRPSNLDNPLSAFTHIVNGYRGGAYGFPSCHAANSFALAVFSAAMLRQRSFTLFVLAWAAVNCYSRVYLGVHYPGDLLVGAIVGSLVGYICCLASTTVFNRFFSTTESGRSVPLLANAPTITWLRKFNLMEIVAIITIIYIIIASAVYHQL